MMRNWVKTELWGQSYFEPERLGPKTTLYSTTFSGPLVRLLIDGHSEHAPWLAEALFERLHILAKRHLCSWLYITDPDDVRSEIEWEQLYDPDWFTSRRLWVFETSPAEQGGTCHLVLVFHDRHGIIVFVFQPMGSFEIAFYGLPDRLTEVHECLSLNSR